MDSYAQLSARHEICKDGGGGGVLDRQRPGEIFRNGMEVTVLARVLTVIVSWHTTGDNSG